MGYLSFVDQYGIYATISYHLTFIVIRRFARCHVGIACCWFGQK